MKSNDKQVTAKIDDIFDKIGEFGPYQLFILFLIGLTAIVPAILAYSYIFIGATPEFRYLLNYIYS
jgi:F0F1-type ATP synthase assembly protein I